MEGTVHLFCHGCNTYQCICRSTIVFRSFGLVMGNSLHRVVDDPLLCVSVFLLIMSGRVYLLQLTVFRLSIGVTASKASDTPAAIPAVAFEKTDNFPFSSLGKKDDTFSYAVHRAACFADEPTIRGIDPAYSPINPCARTVWNKGEKMPVISKEKGIYWGVHSITKSYMWLKPRWKIYETQIIVTNELNNLNATIHHPFELWVVA